MTIQNQDYIPNPESPRKTALYGVHEALGASFTDFGGWEMPLKYDNDVAEHKAVREAAGLFDLSHMGEIRITGPDASALLDYALVSSFSKLTVGRAKYSVMANEQGGLVDDLITYRVAEEEYLVVPNASNADAVLREFTVRGTEFDASVHEETAATSLVALQGPVAAEVLENVLDELHLADGGTELSGLKYYASAPATVGGVDVLLARTGYTGEDGFELYVPNESAEVLWKLLQEAGQDKGVVPAGLAARDSLRLEAGMPLYGHELGADISPFTSGLGRMVDSALKSKADFVGKSALEKAKSAAEDADHRVLVGLKGLSKRPARAGSTLIEGDGDDRREIGEVTSGIPSPTLGYPVALAFVEARQADVGTTIAVDIRGKSNDFEVVELPFYSRSK
ncbi:glycine cleavage system aminomethyltransferase GcvT [Kocuria sp. TGY1127_2]|uniref:glycine cleavage system aminomethyltransferase GcvT n=1 Tax=Kocuria sp. TGY1127_2 TaxID=2711328 RepID=UPI0015BECEF1|nr:glycine cleavage system aminomethyltransferase GcvT [Kocuria sp. TGY1127_2]